MKILYNHIKVIVFVGSLLLCLSTKAQTVLKLESDSQAGIEFDVPIKLQIPLNNKSKPIFVTIYKVPKSIFKLRLNGDMDAKTYYRSILSAPTEAPLNLISPDDKMDEVKDANSTKYLYTLNTPVYFDPNTNYVIGVFNSLTYNTKYAEKLKKILITFIAAHNKLPKPSGQDFSNEEINLDTASNSKYTDQAFIQNKWDTLKMAYATDAVANTYLLAGIGLYDKLSSEVKNDYGFTPIPEKDITHTDFYKVYESIIPLIKLSNNYDSITNFTDTFPDLSKDSCLYDFLRKQLSCISCSQQLPSAGIQKDTTGQASFIIDLLQDRGDTKSFIDKQITTIKVDSILNPFDTQDNNRLKEILEKLQQVKLIMDFTRLSPLGECNPTLPDKINQAYMTVKDAIETRGKEIKLKEKFDSLLSINQSYLDRDPNIFSFDTYVYNADTRYGLRLTPDIGVIDYGLIPKYDYNPGHITPYIGVQINFRYTKSNLPFSSIRGNTPFSLRHFSAFLGVTAFSVKQNGKTDDLFGKSSLALGLGYRFIPEIRMVLGTMLVKKINPNPLISSTKTGSLPFIGISFDANKILQDFIKAF